MSEPDFYTDNTRDSLYVIKVGGSISTNKDGHYELDHNNIRLIGEVLYKSQLWQRYKLLLVFGGGSFGNVAPREYNIFSRNKDVKPENISRMTTTMFSMLSEITTVLASCGVPAYPFQCSALVSHLPDGRWDMHTTAISAAMQQGCLPVITGDLVFKNDGDFMIFSSDNVPELIAEKMAVQHVLYYSDVEGFYSDLTEKKKIPLIKACEINNHKSSAGPSSRQDVTGGMNNKLNQIERLVKRGLSVELLSFRHFAQIDASLNKRCCFGTFFEAGEENADNAGWA